MDWPERFLNGEVAEWLKASGLGPDKQKGPAPQRLAPVGFESSNLSLSASFTSLPSVKDSVKKSDGGFYLGISEAPTNESQRKEKGPL